MSACLWPRPEILVHGHDGSAAVRKYPPVAPRPADALYITAWLRTLLLYLKAPSPTSRAAPIETTTFTSAAEWDGVVAKSSVFVTTFTPAAACEKRFGADFRPAFLLPQPTGCA